MKREQRVPRIISMSFFCLFVCEDWQPHNPLGRMIGNIHIRLEDKFQSIA